MKMKGEMFWFTGTIPNLCMIEAAITPKKISIDWVENGKRSHLEATSNDGEHFTGHYGSSRVDPQHELSMTLYRAKSGCVLVGTWCEHDSGFEGSWYFTLSPDAAKNS